MACAAAALDAPELAGRILGLVGPKAGFVSRQVSHAFRKAWTPEVIAAVARRGVWRACLPAPPSLHSLLLRFSRRSAGPWTRGAPAGGPGAVGASRGPELAAAADSAELFNAAYTLLACVPESAEEPQNVGRVDEECAVVENMCRSPLIVAARCGLVGIAWLIARHCGPGGAGLNNRDWMGCSALRYAIVNKDERMCRCLLGFPGVDLELPDARGDTSLFQAVGANAPGVCLMLMQRRADAAHQSRGQTALDLAEALGYEGCAAVLRQCGAPSSQAAGSNGEAPEGSGEPFNSSPCESEIDNDVLESEGRGRGGVACGELREAASDEEETGCDWEGLVSDDDEELAASGTQRSKRQRWDMGGIFIKARGGQTQLWQG